MDGVLILYKPAGMTSHDAVNRLRRITGERSIGHLGTLDPMATGVLPMLLGRMTRLAQFYLHCEKEYEGEIRLGFATDTYDATGQATGAETEVKCSQAEIREAAGKFIGVIEQTPPTYSAKKIAGVPAYKLARKNQSVELKPVKVEIKRFEINGVRENLISFRAQVASGTYLRSIAHDLGRDLGVGGHLASLRRTAVGEFRIEDACSLEQLMAASSKEPSDIMSDNEYYVKSKSTRGDHGCGFKEKMGLARHGDAVLSGVWPDRDAVVRSIRHHLLCVRRILPALPVVVAPPE